VSEVPASWGEARSKTVTWYDPRLVAGRAATMSGLELLGALVDKTLPPPPITRLFGMDITELERGRVVFTCTPDESAYNPIGVVHGGLVCTLADTVAACAVHTTLDAGVGYTSIDLNVSYLRPVTSQSGELRATGVVTKAGRRVAFSSAEIVDGHGKLVATATSSCLIMAPAADGGSSPS